MKTQHDISEAILQKAQEGDQEAFEEIFETFLGPLYRFAFFRTGSKESAEKLTEDIFLTLWKHIKKFNSAGRIPFTIWVFQKAHKGVSDFLERIKKASPERKKFLQDSIQESQREKHTHPFEDQMQDAFLETLLLIPASQAEAIILKYFCGLSNEQIGMILEKTSGAVRILQSRGLTRLREGSEQKKEKQ